MCWNKELIQEIIKQARREDLAWGDITTDNLIESGRKSEGIILAKEKGMIAGLPVAELVFQQYDPRIEYLPCCEDGQTITAGQELIKLSGPTAAILRGERVALNFLQRLSGIATQTNYYVKLLRDYPVRVVDTRKTTPTLRVLEKYAVRVGGGYNHRMSLADGVLIKDNHIKAAGGIATAISILKKRLPHTVKIEIEVQDLPGVEEALTAGAEIIMLDNMGIEEMKKAVRLIAGKAIVEASGGITDQTVREVATTGVDIISVGALTHHIRALDLSLNLL